MKKITFLFAALAAVLFVNAQTNLVQNGSFEDGFTSWTKGPTGTYTEPSLVTTGGQDGSNYVQYADAAATTGFYQNIAVEVGREYTISFWYKASGDDTDARIWSFLLDDDGKAVYTTDDASTDPLRNNNGYLDTALDWTKHEVTFTVPANVVTLRLAVRAYKGATASFDNFSLVASSGSACTPATFSFAEESVTKNDDDADFTNAFTSNNTSPKAYSSTNTAVATVNATTGKVHIVGPGSTKIEVTQDADDTYCAVAASYNLTIASTAPVSMPDVIITEVYGGGGNAGAILKRDFIELYNTTNSPVDISGWSVQYYSAAGTNPPDEGISVFPAGSIIPAKSYFLIEELVGSGGTVDLTNPDFANGTIAMAAGSGKVVLYTNEERHTIDANDITSITSNAAFKDYVPYGTTAKPVWGTAMSGNISSTTSATRIMEGGEYVYTGNIGEDFEATENMTPTNSQGQVTSIGTSVAKTAIKDLHAYNGTIHFDASAGQIVDVYNVAGQRLASRTTTDGLNSINLNIQGVVIVKLGDKVGKVIVR